MKLQSLFILVSAITLTISCSGDSGRQKVTLLEAPSELKAEAAEASAILSWKDNCSTEKGYYVFLDKDTAPLATLPADSQTYTFTGLTEGTEYRLGVQAFDENTFSLLVWTKVPIPVTDPGQGTDPQVEPDPNPIDAITFTWTEVSGLDLPSAVKVYKTEGKLNDRPVQAWYAIADCTGDISFRVMYPGEKNHKTLRGHRDPMPPFVMFRSVVSAGSE